VERKFRYAKRRESQMSEMQMSACAGSHARHGECLQMPQVSRLIQEPTPCVLWVQAPAVLLANNVVKMLCLPCFAPPEPATSSTTSGSFTYLRVSYFPFQAGAPGAGLLRAALWRRGRRGAGGGGAARQPQIPHPGWRLPPDRRRARVRAVQDFLPYPLLYPFCFRMGHPGRRLPPDGWRAWVRRVSRV